MLLFTFCFHFTLLQALQPEGKWNLLLLCSLLQNRSTRLLMFFLRSLWQAWALAHSPAHHVNKPSAAVQHVWFGWYWGLGRFPYALRFLLSSKMLKLIIENWPLPCILFKCFAIFLQSQALKSTQGPLFWPKFYSTLS